MTAAATLHPKSLALSGEVGDQFEARASHEPAVRKPRPQETGSRNNQGTSLSIVAADDSWMGASEAGPEPRPLDLGNSNRLRIESLNGSGGGQGWHFPLLHLAFEIFRHLLPEI